MLKENKLRAKIVENGMTIPDVAFACGMNAATFYRRIADEGRSFTVREVSDIVACLHMTAAEANDIFFSNFVSEVRQ